MAASGKRTNLDAATASGGDSAPGSPGRLSIPVNSVPMYMKPLTVLLSGNHVLLRAFLRAWLTRFSRMQVVAEAVGVRQTMEFVRKYRPTLLLLDFESHQLDCIDLLRKVRLGFAKVKVIVYFANSNEAFAIRLIRAGASGFVVKSAESEDMEHAIRAVLAGGVYLSSEFLKSIGTSALRGVPDPEGRMLTARQVALLKLIGVGLSVQAMAIGIKRTRIQVKADIKALMKRLGTRSSAATARYAVSAGLIPA